MAEIACGNKEDALDILQEAMMKLVDKYSHLSAEEWGPLFTRILQSKIRDWYRRNIVRNRFRVWFSNTENDKTCLITESIENIADNDNKMPEEIIANDRNIKIIEEVIRTLPLKQQQAFMLRAFESLDTKETADAMGCSQGSVKTHYSRAIKKIRDKLPGELL